MKKFNLINTALLLVFALTLSFITISCVNGFTYEKGNGNITKQDRTVNSFNSIEVSGGYTIYLKQDSTQSLAVEADDNLQSLIITKVENGKLIIKNTESIRGSKPINIYLSAKSIKDISVSGAADIKGSGKFKMKELNFEISGSGDINMDVELQKLTYDCSGASKLNLTGTVETVDATISGAADINAFDLIAKSFTLSSSGAGKANINATENLVIETSGAATVRYKGNPKNISQKNSGVSSIHKVE